MIRIHHLLANDSLLLDLLRREIGRLESAPPSSECVRWDAEDGEIQLLTSAMRQPAIFTNTLWIDILHSETIPSSAEPRRKMILDSILRATVEATLCFHTLEPSDSDEPLFPGGRTRARSARAQPADADPARQKATKEHAIDFWKALMERMPVSLYVCWKGKVPRLRGPGKEPGIWFQRFVVEPAPDKNGHIAHLKWENKEGIADWLIARALAVFGLRLTRENARQILEQVGDQPALLEQALNAIRLRRPEGETLNPGDLDDLPGNPEGKMYYLAQDAFTGNLSRALSIVDLLQRNNIYPGVALGVIGRDIERFILIRKALQEGQDPVAALGEQEFRLRALISAAQRANPSTSVALLEILHRADLRLKITDDNPYEVLKEVLFRISEVVPKSG
ncbi:MAG: DNA polymerase III subunit delta [bacterium JZ-2024 1]